MKTERKVVMYLREMRPIPEAGGRRHKDPNWLYKERIVSWTFTVLALLAGAAATIHYIVKDQYVSPAYTQTVERLYSQAAADGATVYIPTWAPEGAMPQSFDYDADGSVLRIGGIGGMTFRQGRLAIAGRIAAPARTYRRRRSGIDYVYTEIWADDQSAVTQKIAWQCGSIQLSVAVTAAEVIDEMKLWRFALAVRKYAPETAATEAAV